MRSTVLITRVSSLAIAAALTAAASAQSFLGSHNVTFGSVNVLHGTGTTDLFVDSQTAVIDWAPTDPTPGANIVFQNSGTTATFFGSPNFAVLNRINVADPSRAVLLNGTINSIVSESTGGNIFFYSPSGFVVGSSAAINVGSLVLSASPIAVDGNGNFINGSTITFNQASNPNASITTAAGSQINASGTGSYVALVAPQITHRGTIRTDTTAALVAAEAGTITFNPFGLFDIQVTTGTDAATGIHVDGGSIARNSATETVGNIHRAYLVAVAKNDAVTMLINNGGSVGFDTATSAAIEDNAVVLSGGYNVQGGDHSTFSGVSEVPLTITNASLSSHVDAKVTGGVAINSGQGALTFGGDLMVVGGARTTTGGNVLIDGQNGNPLTIAGDLRARAFRINGDNSETGLITRLGAQGGSTVTVGGDVTLDSDSFGIGGNEPGENGTSAVGGNAQVNIGANSTLNVTGSINVHADGYGGYSGNAVAGSGTGGQALVMAIGGNATITVGGSVAASAEGQGGGVGSDCFAGCGVTGGDGIGGNASVHTNLGTGNLMQIGGDVWVSAVGQGGGGDVQAGSGIGGTARIGAADNSDLTIGADTDVDASGWGGYGYDNVGGLGRGGEAGIGTGTGGSIELTGPVFVTADGYGGEGAVGGTGTGRRAYIAAVNGSIHALGEVFVSAFSEGGFGFDPISSTGSGGGGLANTDLEDPNHSWASLYAENGSLTIDGQSFITAGALGGDGFSGGNGGNAVAGRVTVHAGNSDAGPGVVQLTDLFATAEASGGFGGDGGAGTNGGDGGDGGSATGGRVTVTASAGNGELIANDVTVSASAVGGDGGDGGNGDGGNGGNAGDGGNAIGGWFNVGTESGPAVATGSNNGVATYNSIFAFTSAFGGNGGSGGFGTIAGQFGNGGDAIGGDGTLLVRGSTVNVGSVHLDSSAFGGSGGLDSGENAQGIGGDAITGTVAVLVTNRFELPDQRGTLNAGPITGIALATGGDGATVGGQWTQGGGARFEFINSEGTIDSVNLLVGADGLDPDATQTFSSLVAVVESTVDIVNGFNIQTPGRISVHVDDPTPITPALTAASVTISADNFVHDETRPPPPDIGTISADTIGLATNGDLIVDAHLVSTGPLGLFAPGLVEIQDATSGSFINGSAGTSFTAGTLTAAETVSVTATDGISLDLVNAGTDITILSFLGSVGTNGMSSADGSIFVDGVTGVTTGPLTAMNEISIFSETGNVSVGDTSSTLGSIALSAGGSITAGDLAANANIDLAAIGGISFQDASGDRIDFESGGAVSGGNIVAGTFATGEAEGAITLGNINVGVLREGGATEDGFAVGLASATSIAVQNVEADEAIGFATLGGLTAGNLDAGTNVMALVSGNMSFGSISTAADGRTYLADAQMYLANGGAEDAFNPAAVLDSEPLATGGSIAIGGPVSTGLLQAAAGTNFSASAVTAPFGAIVSAGGTITVGGAWNVGDASLTSSDIDIGAAGSITAGDIELVSINATRTVVGDGTGLTGYNLSNAEYGRLSANDINVLADTALGAAPVMIIGDLSVDASDDEIEYDFSTGNSQTEQGEGSIRIVGEVEFTGMDEFDFLDFNTERFEVDAATGLLSLTGAGGALAGNVEIYATNIHIAEGTILDQLAADPQYEGYQADLNAPATVARPDGVIRAGSIAIEFGQAAPSELYTLYVQNTGTADNPAGFLVTDNVLFQEGGDGLFAPGSIDLVINGQIETPGGTLTGVAVRDALVASEGDLAPFTANSTINGCLLTGACVVEPPEPPFPPGFTPTPGIQDEVRLVGTDPTPPPEFGNEDFIDDNDEETDDTTTSPIQPTDPLFNTSELEDHAATEADAVVGTPMRSTPGITSEEDVDDPVSGSGNPALMEVTPNPSNKEEQQ